MSANEQTHDSGSLDLSDDRARAVDEAGRRAGAALRSSAPEHGADAIEGRARRRTRVRTTAAAVAVGVLVVGVVALTTGDGSGDEQPVDTVPMSNPPAPSSVDAVELGNVEGGPARYAADGSLLIGDGDRVGIYDRTLTRVGEVPCPTRLSTLPDPLGTAASADWVWDVDAASQWNAASMANFGVSIWPDLCGVMVNASGNRALTVADIQGDAPPDGGERRLLLWDTSDGSLVKVIEGVWPAFSSDGSRFVTGDPDGLTVWDSSTGAVVTTISDPPTGGSGANVAVSPDGTRMLRWMTTLDGNDQSGGLAIVYELPTLTPIATLSTEEHPDALSQNEALFDTQGRLFSLDGLGVTVWDAATGAVLVHIPIQLALNNNSIAITADGDMVAVAHGDHITIFDSATGAKLTDIALGDEEFGTPMFGPDGATLAATVARGFGADESNVVRIWRLEPTDN